MVGRIYFILLLFFPLVILPPAEASDATRIAEAYRTVAAPFNKAPFDLSYVVSLLDNGTFSEKAYIVMDEAMRRERVLEEARKLAIHASPKTPTRIKERWERDYCFLKCRLRLLVGVSRAAIAQRMAQPSSRSYASQAMELAIDSLRDSAQYSEKSAGSSQCLGKANPGKERILSFRLKLLDIWDRSQKQADVAPIKEMDLRKLVRETLAQGSDQ